MTMYQVITVCKVNDSVSMTSEGFFDDEHQAYSHADYVRERFYLCCELPFDVFVLSHSVEL